MITIGIAEDQALMRESLAIAKGLEADLEIAWKTETGRQTVDAIKENKVDVVLMDLRMPDMDGVTATKSIHSMYPKTKVIVLTTFDHDEWILDAIHAGASLCLLKEVPPKQLLEAIRLIHSNQFLLSKWTDEWRKFAPEIQFKANLRDQNGWAAQTKQDKWSVDQETLTHRDLEILSRIGQNLTNVEIAQALFLTEGIVKNYISNLYLKIGVKNRAEAIRYCKQKGIV
ncbi:response regulator transcription factor [Pullulanibacillus sp. KACC 23026]|uniref:response regulator transcription factor n=1 Tax=Pullulanibacillus sp. KACC 23026 TaxID=3028315 RepID=UPI0023AFFDB7|nr:response regulator transcription factor [Pullulanibacillus sp. KACC 23026]WEG14775.1 response regulator transcription factor [Pullulanibacillus sp. KACC 23026]